MKHRPLSFRCLGLCLASLLFLCGCTPGDLADRFSLDKEAATDENASRPRAERVYMDEVSGKLSFFDGNMLSLTTENDIDYTFDVSDASIECANGLLYQDTISVIYEGHLAGTDTGSVRALKVTDILHKKEQPAEHILSGTIQALSPYAITIAAADGRILVLSIIGRKACFQDGLALGKKAFLHVKGDPVLLDDNTWDCSLMNVISLSDQEPMQIPPPPSLTRRDKPQVQTEEDTAQADVLQSLRGSIETISGQQLTFKPKSSDLTLTLDLSVIPFYLPGGLLHGTALNLYYRGQFNGQDLTGISLEQIQGNDPASRRMPDTECLVEGTVVGLTGNTVTIRTPDGILFHCYTRGADILSPGSLDPGSSLTITLKPDPEASSNIHEAFQMR